MWVRPMLPPEDPGIGLAWLVAGASSRSPLERLGLIAAIADRLCVVTKRS